jgi:hypothetical protein
MPDTYDVERPPHFRETPEQRTRTEAEPYPPSDFPGGEETTPYTEQAYEPPEHEPLEVIVANMPAETENRDWSAGTMTVQDTRMVRLAGDSPTRRRLYIRNNDDADSVFLGRNQTDSLFAMYELVAGQSVEMFHQGEVWAISATGLTVSLAVFQEFVLREV